MTILNTTLKSQIKETLNTNFGHFYFLDKIIVGEVNHGAILSNEDGLQIINEAKEIYGPDTKYAYISNRINPFSVRPTDWVKMYGLKKTNISVFSIVAKKESSWAVLLMEKYFKDTNVNTFYTLEEAVAFSKESIENSQNPKSA